MTTNHSEELGQAIIKWRQYEDNIDLIKSHMCIIQRPDEFFNLDLPMEKEQSVEEFELYSKRQAERESLIGSWCDFMNITINIFTCNPGEDYFILRSSPTFGHGKYVINLINHLRTHFDLITSPLQINGSKPSVLIPHRKPNKFTEVNKIFVQEKTKPMVFSREETAELLRDYNISEADFRQIIFNLKEAGQGSGNERNIRGYLEQMGHVKKEAGQGYSKVSKLSTINCQTCTFANDIKNDNCIMCSSSLGKADSIASAGGIVASDMKPKVSRLFSSKLTKQQLDEYRAILNKEKNGQLNTRLNRRSKEFIPREESLDGVGRGPKVELLVGYASKHNIMLNKYLKYKHKYILLKNKLN